MEATLPMLEAHPWVSRYNWFGSFSEGSFGPELVDKTTDPYKLTPLGDYYNTYHWDGSFYNMSW